MIEIVKPKFAIGTLVATPNALAALTEEVRIQCTSLAVAFKAIEATVARMIGRRRKMP